MERRSLPPFEDDFARALLRSAEHDEPPQTAYAKAATALGVGVGIGVGASLPVAAAGAAASAGRWGAPLATKLAAFAVSGLVLVGASAVLLKGQAGNAGHGAADSSMPAAHASTLGLGAPQPANAVSAPAAPMPPNAPAVVPGTGERAALVEPARELADSALSADAPAAPALVPARRPSAKSLRAKDTSTRAPSSTASNSSLGEQVRSLDRARVALASGDANGALAELLHYRRSYPHGVFLTEASVLEVEAIAARGDRSLAAVRASEFVAAHPDSPQAERLRALIPKKKP